jgi:hypothetical protein
MRDHDGDGRWYVKNVEEDIPVYKQTFDESRAGSEITGYLVDHDDAYYAVVHSFISDAEAVELDSEEITTRWVDSTHDTLRKIQNVIVSDCLLGNDLPADMADIGNEVGYIVGTVIENMTPTDIEDFITGFRHGISLTNNTH